MKAIIPTLFHKIASLLRERCDLLLKMLALRHQLAVLERTDVRIASSSMGRLGKCAFIQRQMRAQLRGRKREDSRRAVA
jgi:hypothetical protein